MRLPPAALFFVAGFLLTGCSTIESRIEKNRAAFDRLPALQQTLVKRGEIREGLNEDAVYLAWGKPDDITHGSEGGRRFDVWIYYRYRQDTIDDYEYVPRRYGRHIGFDSVYRPRYVTRASLDRRVVFERGKVVAWETVGW
jgi:hypothetical protein